MENDTHLEEKIMGVDPRLPQPQRTRWGKFDGKPAGICIDRRDGQFIPWSDLKTELEERLLSQLANIPFRSTVSLAEYRGHPDWVVQIIDPNNTEIANIWFGQDPDQGWGDTDGLVRIGWARARGAEKTEVWQVFQRYSDGTYHRIRSFI